MTALQGMNVKIVLLLVAAGLHLEVDDQSHGNDTDDNGRQMIAGAVGDVGDKALAKGQEALLADDDGAGLGQGQGQQATEDEHAGQGGDEGRHTYPHDQSALIQADQQADQQNDENGEPLIDAVGLHQNSGDGACEAGHIADGQVDVLQDQDQRHADGKHGNVGGLIKEVGDVGGLKEFAAGPDLEEQHDEDQSDIHHIALDVVFQKPSDLRASRLLLIFHFTLSLSCC